MTTRKTKRHEVEDMVLPHSMESERAVLGAILLNNGLYDRATKHLTTASFYRAAHASIYSSLARLLDAPSGVADLMLLREDLSTHGVLEDVGGAPYIASLVDGVPRSVNLEHYAQIVKEKALLRACITVGNRLVTDAYVGEDPAATLIAAADHAIVGLQHGARTDQMRGFAVGTYLDVLEYRDTHRGELTGPTTGFKSLDELTLGWQRGDLIVIGARPSIGKTTLVMNAAEAAAEAGARVAVFSMEMKRTQLDDRRVAAKTGVDLSRIQSGYIYEAEWAKITQALGEMGSTPLFVDDTPSQTVQDIRSTCRRLKSDGGLDLVVIDYIQLMPGSLDRRGATRNEEITHISRGLKVLAGDLHVAILVLSQLNRGGDGRADPRPKLSDLRESGALEQDADIVLFLHRKHHRESGTTQAIIEKQRNGPTGTVNLTLTRETCRFTDGGEEPPPPTEAEKQEAKTRSIIRSRANKR